MRTGPDRPVWNHLALALVPVVALAACKKSEEPVREGTHLCGSFRFQVTGKSEASDARIAFYAASVRLRGLDFADDRFSNSSRFVLGGQFIVLRGLQDYLDVTGDPPRELEVVAYRTVRNTPSVQSVPCSSPGAAAAFDAMKAVISKRWKIEVEQESPEYERQRSAR